MQSLLSIQNIKLLFIVASGLYSLNFLHRYRSSRNREKIIERNREIILGKLDNMTYEDYSSQRIYEIFGGIGGNGHGDGKGNGQQSGQDGKDGGKGKDKGRDIGGTGKKDKQTQSKQQRKNQQPAGLQQEIEEIMLQHLLQKLQQTKSISQLKSQLQSYSQFQPQPQLPFAQSPSQITFPQMFNTSQLRIKPCQKIITNLQDAITVELPQKDDSFEYIPPDTSNFDKNMEDQEPSFQEIMRKKKCMLSNQEVLRKFWVDGHGLRLGMGNGKEIGVRRRIRRIRRIKGKLRMLGKQKNRTEGADEKNEEKDIQQRKINRQKISKKKQLLTFLQNQHQKQRTLPKPKKPHHTHTKTNNQLKRLPSTSSSPSPTPTPHNISFQQQKCCSCKCQDKEKDRKKQQQNTTMMDQQQKKSVIDFEGLPVKKEGLRRIVTKTTVHYQYVDSN